MIWLVWFGKQGNGSQNGEFYNLHIYRTFQLIWVLTHMDEYISHDESSPTKEDEDQEVITLRVKFTWLNGSKVNAVYINISPLFWKPYISHLTFLKRNHYFLAYIYYNIYIFFFTNVYSNVSYLPFSNFNGFSIIRGHLEK